MIVPGGEILTGALDLISQSLTIPVLIILLVIFLLALITIGATIAEYSSRKVMSVDKIKELIYDIHEAGSVSELKNIINNSQLPDSQKIILDNIANSESLNNNSREILARKLVESEAELVFNKEGRNKYVINIKYITSAYKYNILDINEMKQLLYSKLIFNERDYLQAFKEVHNRNFDENDVIDIKEDMKNLNEKMIEYISKFCDEYDCSIENIKRNNYLIVILAKDLKNKFNVTNKMFAEYIGIGKNRISILNSKK